MLCLNISDITIITVKSVNYCCIMHDISKSEAIHLLENFVLELKIVVIYKNHININQVYNDSNDLLKPEQIEETKNVSIDEKTLLIKLIIKYFWYVLTVYDLGVLRHFGRFEYLVWFKIFGPKIC